MKKRKDYLKLFVKYASDNRIWYAVYGNGDIDEAMDTENMCDLENPDEPRLGSKAAYDWLVKAHKEAK